MQESFVLINSLAAEYGGEAFTIHGEIQAEIPKEKYDEFIKELNNIS